jgi:MFS family permease
MASVRRTFPAPPRMGTSAWEEVRAGARSFFTHPTSRFIVARLLPFQFLLMGFMTVIPIKVRDLDAGRQAIGWLSGMQGIGAVLGSLFVTKAAARFGRRHTLQGVLVGGSIAVGLYGASHRLWLALPAVAIVGTCVSSCFVLFMSTLQRDVPNELRGRVMATNQAFMGATFTSGALLTGVLADLVGLTPALAACALVHLALVAVPLLRAPHQWRIVDRAPTHPA